MKKLSLLVAAGSLAAASSAMADDHAASAFTTSASVALSTDYMYRGASQTDNEAAISGSFDVNHASGAYAGVWASNVDGNDVHIELNAYAGFAGELADTGVGYDVGFKRYFFPGNDRNLDWNEGYLGLSHGPFSLTVSHSTDALGTGEDGTHYLLGFNHDLPMGLHFHAGYAFYHFDDIDDVALALGAAPAAIAAANIDDTLEDFGIGVSKDMFGFNFDLTYYNTLSEGEDLTELLNNGSDAKSDDRVVFTISKSL